MPPTKATLSIVANPSGEVIGVSISPRQMGRNSGVAIEPASPKDVLHEVEVPGELLGIDSVEELVEVVERYLPKGWHFSTPPKRRKR